MQFTITIKQPFLSLIKSGKKTIEVRLCKGILIKLRQGDIIIWNNQVRTYVTFIHNYDSFDSLFSVENKGLILPKNIDISILYKFYSKQDEQTFGVLAIGLTLIMVHVSNLKQPHFDNVKSCRKLFEIRLHDKKRQNIHSGDIWLFIEQETGEIIATHVTSKHIAHTFSELITTDNLQQVMPDSPNIASALRVYDDLYKDTKGFDVVIFSISLIKTFKVHHMSITQELLESIKLNLKTMDIFPASHNTINTYDMIVYNNAVNVLVTYTKQYDSPNACFEHEDASLIFPACKNPQDLLNYQSCIAIRFITISDQI